MLFLDEEISSIMECSTQSKRKTPFNISDSDSTAEPVAKKSQDEQLDIHEALETIEKKETDAEDA